MNHKTILLTFSIKEGAVSDFFMKLALKLSKKIKVIIITDGQRDDLVNLKSNPIILTWPSKRPTKWKDAKFLFKVIKKNKPVLSLSIFGSVNMTILLGFIFGIKHRIAWIRTTSKQFKKPSKLHIWRKKLIYKLATKIFANSYATKKDSIKYYNINPKKLEVFYNAIKLPNLSSSIEKKNNQIIYVGRLHQNKGVDILIKAFANILKDFSQTKLLIIGSGPEEIKLKQLTQQLNLNRHIEFKGSIPHIKVYQYFAESLFSVVPSFYEAFGFVIIESFAVKTPVIASNTEGPAEIIRHKKDGFLFEPGNEKELETYMRKLLFEPELAILYGKNAYQQVKEKFEINKATDILSDIILEQIKRSNK